MKESGIILLSCLVLFISTTYAQLNFTNHTITTALNNPREVRAADFDGDGDEDLIAISGLGFLRWLENQGNFDFQVIDIDNETDSRTMDVVDLDNDGDYDILTESISLGEFYWFSNDGAGTFTKLLIGSGFSDAFGIYSGDLNGDGNCDVVGCAKSDSLVLWWENDGSPEDGGWIQHTLGTGLENPTTIRTGDMDNDGDIDVVAGMGRNGDLIWWENGDDDLWAEHEIDTTPDRIRRLRIDDIDQDGNLDIITIITNSGVYWYENIEGDPHVFEEHCIGFVSEGRGLGSGDMDNDGDIDILTSGSSIHHLDIFVNDGNQNFTSIMAMDNLSGPHGLSVADMDHDGDLDILEVSFNMGRVYIGENHLDPELLSPFELISPEDGNLVESFNLTFCWENSRCIIPGLDVNYVLYISTDVEFTDPILIETGRDTVYTIEENDIEDNNRYWWKVRANVDELSAFSEDEWYFDISIPVPPTGFNLLTPENETVIHDIDVLFTWETAIDPNLHDQVNYTLYLAEDNEFTEPIPINAGADTVAVSHGFNFADQYWWKVGASDGVFEEVTSEQVWTFTYRPSYPPVDLNLDLIIESGEVNLTWNCLEFPGNEDFEYFKIYRDDEFIDNSAELTFSDYLPSSGTFIYYVTAHYVDGESAACQPEEITWNPDAIPEAGYNEIPAEYLIAETYPNPFNPSLTVTLAIPEISSVQLQVFDILGKQVDELANGVLQAGYHQFDFRAGDFASGIYIIKAFVPGKMNASKKVILLK